MDFTVPQIYQTLPGLNAFHTHSPYWTPRNSLMSRLKSQSTKFWGKKKNLLEGFRGNCTELKSKSDSQGGRNGTTSTQRPDLGFLSADHLYQVHSVGNPRLRDLNSFSNNFSLSISALLVQNLKREILIGSTLWLYFLE